jgi:hypothetical protein
MHSFANFPECGELSPIYFRFLECLIGGYLFMIRAWES